MTIESQQSVSPTDENLDETSAASSAAVNDENLGSSPEGEQPETEETLTDAIADALKPEGDDDDKEGEGESEDDAKDEDRREADPDKEESDEKAEGDKEKGERREKEAEEQDDEGDDLEEGQRVPYDRFKKVIDQRNETRQKLSSMEQEVDQYREGHQQFEAIQSFLGQNDLRQQDAVEALQIAAMMNNDPAKALEMLQPKLQMLQQFTGDALPQDLQDQVETGEISREAARELVKTRNQNALLQQRQQRSESQQREQQTRQQTQATQQAMAQAADSVQRQIVEADPEYGKKAPFVQKELQVLISQRNPRTPDEAAALVREAHKNVTRELQRIAPRRQVRPGPSSTDGGTSPAGSNEPDSMRAALEQALGNSS